MSSVAHADRTITGTVFVDRDGDGQLGGGDATYDNGHVFWESARHVAIGSGGSYSLVAPDDAGIVWVWAGSDVDPGPFFAAIPAGGDRTADLALSPATGQGEFTFVHASDTHAGHRTLTAAEQAIALGQAVSLDPEPYFVVVTGDITAGNMPEHFAEVDQAIASIPVPYVPVPGNHDWYDGGDAYREHFGPDQYAFHAGGIRFIVLNYGAEATVNVDFVATLMALEPEDMPTVAFSHAPFPDTQAFDLDALGVDYAFTGHRHANRVLSIGNLSHYNTQPLAMGGIDMTPAGYRVVFMAGDGGLDTYHRTLVNSDIAVLSSPGPAQRFAPCEARVSATIAASMPVVNVTAEVMGEVNGASVTLQRDGEWVWTAVLTELCQAGSWPVVVIATLIDGSQVQLEGVVDITDEPVNDVSIADWPMLHRSADHRSEVTQEVQLPLGIRWTTSVGGHIAGGSPVVADGRVFLPVSDLGAGAAGGVVALDAQNGELLWRYQTGYSVRNAAAVWGDTVVLAANDGTIHAVGAADGAQRWTYELAPGVRTEWRNIYSAPTIADGVVYIGVAQEMVALDVATGDVVWSVNPDAGQGSLPSASTPAIASGQLLATLERGDRGLYSYDVETGDLEWQSSLDQLTLAAMASPVIHGEQVIVINGLTTLAGVDRATGDINWSVKLEEDAFDWSYSSTATPVVNAQGLVFVATQEGSLHAVDADDGEVVWRQGTDEGLVRTSHYDGAGPSVHAGPVVTPGVVWLAGVDGMLRGFEDDSGAPIWEMDLGVPVLASPVFVGDLVIVAAYDGTVHALQYDELAPPGKPRSGGCVVADGSGGAAWFALVAIIVLGCGRKGFKATLLSS